MSRNAITYCRNLMRAEDGTPLSPRDRHVLLVIATHCNPFDGVAFPSIATMALETGYSEHTIARAIKHLEAHQTLICIRPPNQGRGQNNRYVLPGASRSTPETRRFNANRKSQQPTEARDEVALAVVGEPLEGSQQDPEGWQPHAQSTTKGPQWFDAYKEETETKPNIKNTKRSHAPPFRSRSARMSQADFDQMDYRRFCREREALTRELQENARARIGMPAVAITQEHINRVAAAKAGISPERLRRLVALEDAE